MAHSPTTDRRSLLVGAGLTLAAGLRPLPAWAGTLVIGFIYVGSRDDYGYNQSHAEAAAALRAMPGVRVLEEERVPESDDVERTMQSMIELDGASLIFATSFGYFDPYMLRMAAKYPAVQFRNCGGLWSRDRNPMNAGSYFAYIGMGMYLNGIAAAHASKTKKLGFVAAKPIPLVLININSFTLGARSVDPSITTQAVFTGDWSMPVKEAEATNSLLDGGIDVVTCHVDSPKVVIETAARRGAFVCGYHTDQSALAPDAYLTGAEWNWAAAYRMFVEDAQRGVALPNFVRGGLAEGYVKMSPYGPALSDGARRNVDGVRAEMTKGVFSVFKGPLNDNAGRPIIAAGKAYPETAIELESMNYLVEGVRGSLG